MSYYTSKRYCCYCTNLILNGDYYLNGCIIPSCQSKTCKYKNTDMHMNCFILHIEKKECTIMNSLFLSQDLIIDKTCYYVHNKNTKEKDINCLTSCPFKCNKDYKDMLKREYIELSCWIDRHALVCPVFLKHIKKDDIITSMIIENK